MALGDTDRVVSQYLAAMADKDAQYVEQDVLHHPPPRPMRPLKSWNDIPHIDRAPATAVPKSSASWFATTGRTAAIVFCPIRRSSFAISVRAKTKLRATHRRDRFPQSTGRGFRGSEYHKRRPSAPAAGAGETCTVDFYVDIPDALLHFACLSSRPFPTEQLDRYTICDFIENAVVLEMSPPEGPLYGPFRFPCRIQVNSRLRLEANATAIGHQGTVL